jgi:hypothetical protein
MVFQKTAALTMVQTNQWQWVNGSKAPHNQLRQLHDLVNQPGEFRWQRVSF